MSRIVSLVALVVVVLVVGALSYKVMASFLLPMFLAVLLVVIFRPLHQWFLGRFRGRDRLAALATTASILIIVLLPTLLIFAHAADEAYHLATASDRDAVAQRLTALRQRFNLELPPTAALDQLDQIQSTLEQLHVGSPLVPKPKQVPEELQTVDALEHQTKLLRAELGLDGPPPEKDYLVQRREAQNESWLSLHERVEALRKAKPDSPEFDAALTDVSASFDAFRETVLGAALTRWLRRQVNPDEEQRAALVAKVQEIAGPLVLGTGQFLGSLLIGLGVMIISLYYFLADGPAMIRTLMRLSPLDDRYEEQLLTEFATVSRAVVVATLLSAFAQGLLASIGYFFAGFESVFLLTVLTMFLAMIPFVGAAGVWGGCALWLFFFEERIGAAIALAIYGAAVVSMIDNLIKPLVLHGQSSLHPLLALLSVLGGVKALGPIGIFVGPMGVAFLQALLNMLHTELTSINDAGKGAAPSKK